MYWLYSEQYVPRDVSIMMCVQRVNSELLYTVWPVRYRDKVRYIAVYCGCAASI